MGIEGKNVIYRCILVGGWLTNPIWKNMRKSKWGKMNPNIRDEKSKKYLKPPPSIRRHPKNHWKEDTFFVEFLGKNSRDSQPTKNQEKTVDLWKSTKVWAFLLIHG